MTKTDKIDKIQEVFTKNTKNGYREKSPEMMLPETEKKWFIFNKKKFENTVRTQILIELGFMMFFLSELIFRKKKAKKIMCETFVNSIQLTSGFPMKSDNKSNLLLEILAQK